MKKIFIIFIAIAFLGATVLSAQEVEQEKQEKKEDTKIKLLIGPKFSWKDYDVQGKMKYDYRKYSLDISVFVPLLYKNVCYIDFGFRTDFNYFFKPANALRPEFDGLSSEEAYMFELGLSLKGLKLYLAPGLYQFYSMEWSGDSLSFIYLYGVLGQAGLKYQYGYFISSMSVEYRQLWGVEELGDLNKADTQSEKLRMVKHKHLDATLTAGCALDTITIEPGFSVRSRDTKVKNGDWSGWDSFDKMEYIVLLKVGIFF